MPSMTQARMASSAEMLAVFADEALIALALAFEAALAQAETECGGIPREAAKAIAEATRSCIFDAAALAEAAQ
ncbi:3-carboxy-cis,cis-muconate cycloisomerase [Rhizobiales bacterium GAS113]|nr:3-carboxy-cis,cis-muconate cycloisomerase [Rhizobiales bacterium GAS113]